MSRTTPSPTRPLLVRRRWTTSLRCGRGRQDGSPGCRPCRGLANRRACPSWGLTNPRATRRRGIPATAGAAWHHAAHARLTSDAQQSLHPGLDSRLRQSKIGTRKKESEQVGIGFVWARLAEVAYYKWDWPRFRHGHRSSAGKGPAKETARQPAVSVATLAPPTPRGSERSRSCRSRQGRRGYASR